jgi:hypothetical protein
MPPENGSSPNQQNDGIAFEQISPGTTLLTTIEKSGSAYYKLTS